MAIGRRRGIEPCKDEDLPRRIAQVVLPPQHMAHAHLEIVDRVREQESDTAIGAADHEITEIGNIDVAGSKHEVLPRAGQGASDPPAPNRPLALCQPALAFRSGQGSATPGVPGRLSTCHLQCAVLCKGFHRTKTRIDPFPVEAGSEVPGIDPGALGLPVGAAGSPHIGTFRPVETEPPEIGEERGFAARIAPGPVRILDPDEEGSTRMPGLEEIEEGRPGIPQMDRTGRARREAKTNIGRHARHVNGTRKRPRLPETPTSAIMFAWMALYFISDLHLDPGRPGTLAAADRWLASIRTDATALYILGDLFETWIGDDDSDPAFDPIFDRLMDFHAVGVPVFFMVGNRDFLIGPDAARRGGWTLLTEPASLDCYGTHVALLHGDRFCLADREYQSFRAEVRNPDWQRAFLSQPVARRRELARIARQASQAHMGQIADAIMDVDPQAIDAFMRERDLTCIVHGHTHRPAIHEWVLDGVKRTRIVLGDWHDAGQILRWDEAGRALLSTAALP